MDQQLTGSAIKQWHASISQAVFLHEADIYSMWLLGTTPCWLWVDSSLYVLYIVDSVQRVVLQIAQNIYFTPDIFFDSMTDL